MAEESEIDRLDPVPVTVKLTSGFEVEVVRLRTRQLFRLMRILTRGASPAALSQLNFSDSSDEGKKAFSAQLFSVLIMAIPDAEQEAIAFLQSMMKPAGLKERPAAQLSKAEAKANEDMFARFSTETFNPDLEDTLNLMEAIITQEAPEIQALGKKLQHLWSVARKAVGNDQSPLVPEGASLHSPDLTPTSSTS